MSTLPTKYYINTKSSWPKGQLRTLIGSGFGKLIHIYTQRYTTRCHFLTRRLCADAVVPKEKRYFFNKRIRNDRIISV